MNNAAAYKQNFSHIMVVDDEEIVREILRAGICRIGFECSTADSPTEALRILEEYNDIQIVLSDIIMPGVVGTKLCKTIKEKFDVDVILMTGNLENFSYVNAIEEGASDFIRKPIIFKELDLRIRHLLEHRKAIIERNKIYEEQKETLNHLKSALANLRVTTGGVVQLLSAVVEVRDPYTAGHQRRVADFARLIATEMGLTKRQVDGIRMAGIVHDIGKISVPAEILSKPSALSDSEFELIKKHSVIGYDLLKNIKFPWPIDQIVFQHHWRLNGTGYPGPINENEFLLESQIIGVVDVVEAMSSHRPYRPALGLDMALKEIETNKGLLYNPEVVDMCVKLLESGMYSFQL